MHTGCFIQVDTFDTMQMYVLCIALLTAFTLGGLYSAETDML